MRLRKLVTTSVFILVTPALGVAGWFGPSNYEECILDSMKGVTSDKAASMISRSCRNKFQEKQEKKVKSRKLSDKEIAEIKGDAALRHGSIVEGNIYNGNPNITLTEITFLVSWTTNAEKVTRPYHIYIADITPHTSSRVSFVILKGEKSHSYFSLSIDSAKGY